MSVVDLAVAAADEAPDSREPFAAFVTDTDTADAARTVARRRDWNTGDVRDGDLAVALRELGIVPPARVTLVDLGDAAATEQTLSAVRDLADASRVIAVGTHNDVDVYRHVVGAGAVDYLVKPVTADALGDAVQRAEQATIAVGEAAAPKGRSFAVVNARGGAGASTVAAGLAALIGSHHGRGVGLVDLDLHFGSQALAFDVEPGPGLRDAMEDPERVDEIFIDRAAVRLGEHLHLLAAEESLDDVPQPAATSLARITDAMRGHYPVTVLDVPRPTLAAQPDGLAEISDLVIVTDLSLPGLRDTNRLIRFVRAQKGAPQIHVVANRAGKGGRGRIATTEFARELDVELARVLPADGEAAAKAEIGGVTIPHAAPRARFTRELSALTRQLTETRGRRRRALARLLKRG